MLAYFGTISVLTERKDVTTCAYMTAFIITATAPEELALEQALLAAADAGDALLAGIENERARKFLKREDAREPVLAFEI